MIELKDILDVVVNYTESVVRNVDVNDGIAMRISTVLKYRTLK